MIFSRRPDVSGLSPEEAARALCRHIIYMQERLELAEAERRRKLQELEKRLRELESREE